MKKTTRIALLLMISFVCACESAEQDKDKSDDPGDGTPVVTPATWELKTPKIVAISPPEMRVGEYVEVFGENFVPTQFGSTRLKFVGKYFPEGPDVKPNDVELLIDEDQIIFDNTGLVRFRLAPRVLFDTMGGEHIGHFEGEVTAINVMGDEQLRSEKPAPYVVEIGPSIILTRSKPVGSDCQPVVSDTVENINMSFGVKAIGFPQATDFSPLQYTLSFPANSFQLWGVNAKDTILDGVTIPGLNFDQPPQDFDPDRQGFAIAMNVDHNDEVIVGGQEGFAWAETITLTNGTEIVLKDLKTGVFPEMVDNTATTINISVKDDNGNVTRFEHKMNIWETVELKYDQSFVEAERYQAELVSVCEPGGDIGRELSYSEVESHSYSRSVTESVNKSAALNLGLPGAPFTANTTFNSTFGFDKNSSVSTEKSKSLQISAQILPGQFAAIYRQTVRIVREAEMVAHGVCGQTVLYGTVKVDDFLFAPEIAVGGTCIPDTTFPDAEKFIEDAY